MESKASLATEDQTLQKWRLKRMLKYLQRFKGSGTSLITLLIPPGHRISQMTELLRSEYGKASNIKSRVNGLSVESAIRSAEQRLKLYKETPRNGLAIFVGTAVDEDDGKEKKLVLDITPFRPVPQHLYWCGPTFQLQALFPMLHDEETFGFIIINGEGALYAFVTGSQTQIITKFEVQLPKKQAKGGQSAPRFQRLRLLAGDAYVKKAAETATRCFISNNIPNVKGLILAGSAQFKEKLATSPDFDSRLRLKILGTLDISYGMTSGLQQAIGLSADMIKDVAIVKEKKVIQEWMMMCASIEDSNKVCFGAATTLRLLESGVVERLLVNDQLNLIRQEVMVGGGGGGGGGGADRGRSLLPASTSASASGSAAASERVEIRIKKPLPTFAPKSGPLPDADSQATTTPVRRSQGPLPQTSVDERIVGQEPLLDWLVENASRFGASLVFVTDQSSEGKQFLMGFGGFAAFLRYAVDTTTYEDAGSTAKDLEGDDDFEGDALEY